MMGSNTARYCAVGRPGCHEDQAERTGAFYNFIGESRVGMSIALKLLHILGRDIVKVRGKKYEELVESEKKNMFICAQRMFFKWCK